MNLKWVNCLTDYLGTYWPRLRYNMLHILKMFIITLAIMYWRDFVTQKGLFISSTCRYNSAVIWSQTNDLKRVAERDASQYSFCSTYADSVWDDGNHPTLSHPIALTCRSLCNTFIHRQQLCAFHLSEKSYHKTPSHLKCPWCSFGFGSIT